MALSPAAKLLWYYLLDHCDNSGVVDPNTKLASFQIGQAIEPQHFTELGDRLQTLPNGKLWIPKFIRFQHGVLSGGSLIHQSIIKLIQSHALDYPIPSVSHEQAIRMGLKSHKVKVQGKGKVPEGMQGEENGHYHKDARTALHWLNEKSGCHYRETDTNLSFISARLEEPEITIEGVKQMINRQCSLWKNDALMERYLRPLTLFNKSKFDAYYGAKDVLPKSLKPGEIGYDYRKDPNHVPW